MKKRKQHLNQRKVEELLELHDFKTKEAYIDYLNMYALSGSIEAFCQLVFELSK